MKAELKPCPCGGKAYFWGNLTYGLTLDKRLYFVRCGTCNVRTDDFSNEDDAKKMWNIRVYKIPKDEEKVKK